MRSKKSIISSLMLTLTSTQSKYNRRKNILKNHIAKKYIKFKVIITNDSFSVLIELFLDKNKRYML